MGIRYRKRTKPYHAAALALVGWYLMMPPNACELSSACKGHSIFWGIVSMPRPQSESNIQSEMAWRNRMDNDLVLDAPLSEWHQIDEFETLAECRARYEENQKPLPNEQQQYQDLAKSQLTDEGTASPSGDALRSRADLLVSSLRLQTIQEMCVASDDPRLAK